MLKLSIAMLKLPIASAVLIVIFWSQVVVIVIPGLPWQPPAVRQHSTGGKYTSKHSSAPPHMISKSHRFLTYICVLSLLCAETYCTVVTLVSLHFSTILVTLVTLHYIAVLATRACWLPDCPGLSSWLISGNHHTASPSSSQSSSTSYSLSQSSWKPPSTNYHPPRSHQSSSLSIANLVFVLSNASTFPELHQRWRKGRGATSPPTVTPPLPWKSSDHWRAH